MAIRDRQGCRLGEVMPLVWLDEVAKRFEQMVKVLKRRKKASFEKVKV